MDPTVSSLLADLRRTRFRDLAGARIAARIPIASPLLNRLVADALRQTTAPVRRIDVRPLPGDRFECIVSLKWALVPPLTVAVTIEQQPAIPESPILVLRWSLPAGLSAVVSQFVGALKSLPDGVRLETDRVLLDLQRLAARGPATEAWSYVTGLELHTTEAAAVIDVTLAA